MISKFRLRLVWQFARQAGRAEDTLVLPGVNRRFENFYPTPSEFKTHDQKNSLTVQICRR